MHKAYTIAVEKGFWDDENHNDNIHYLLSRLMLIVTEVGEAAESRLPYGEDNLPEELADIAIRIFDLAGGTRINLESVIEEIKPKNFIFLSGVLPNLMIIVLQLCYAAESLRKCNAIDFEMYVARSLIHTEILANRLFINLEQAIIAKNKKNIKRSRMHGKLA